MLFDSLIFAADHVGFSLKEGLIRAAQQNKWPWKDLGVFDQVPMDYPDIVPPLVDLIQQKESRNCGILICGSGIGVSIAANRYAGIRAALCHEGLSARLARQHNDANILVLGGRLIGLQMALHCLTEFITTTFEGGRHVRRLEKIETTQEKEKGL